MTHIPVKTPGGFAPAVALGHADALGNFALISADNPLPVTGGAAAAPVTVPPALTGSTDSAIVAGPYTPVAGRAVYVQLSGEWDGTVRLLRSTDAGATRLPLTLAGAQWGAFSGNACEAVWEESEVGAQLYLELAPASGTIVYRVSQ